NRTQFFPRGRLQHFQRGAGRETCAARQGLQGDESGVGFEVMANPSFAAGKPVMFVAGDDAAGKKVVLDLVASVGFEAIDAGELAIARLLEPYAMLWIQLMARRNQGRNFAFSLLRR